MTSLLSYYYDMQLTKKVHTNEKGIPIIDWGETVPGQKKEKILFIKNNRRDRIIIRQPYSNDEDFHIVDYPQNLFGLESGVLKLEFTPNINRTEPLKSEWGFDLVLG